MSFKAIIGLGNHGNEYKNTRHNIGFEIIDAFAEKFPENNWENEKKFGASLKKIKLNNNQLILIKSLGFMNLSGRPLAKICSFYKILPQEIIVICDDFTIDLANVKLTERSGTAGHNGVASILECIGEGFVRFRVGIGQKPIKQMPLADYVLSKFSQDEINTIVKNKENILKNLNLLLDKGVFAAMNVINRKI
jgi:PTH1 family peptidyl-tRNA hydrolase